jgi:hypothetical protein
MKCSHHPEAFLVSRLPVLELVPARNDGCIDPEQKGV